MNTLPIRHVLCPMDLLPISMNALEWANAVARARNAELRMLHVVGIDGIVAAESLGFSEHDDMMSQLREAHRRIDPDNRQVGAAVRQGDPGNKILEFARSMSADVIVMGAAGVERPTRPIGSVTATVVARSDCPVLIVPSGRQVNPNRAGLFDHILCAVDLAPSSVGVMRQALSLGWETHARVVFACITTEPDPSREDVEDRLLAAIPAEAKQWCDVEIVVKSGMPATEIVKVAERLDVDLLVIGPPRHWSSTTQAVLARSLCPALVTQDARRLPYPTPERTGSSSEDGARST
jgi:nucleotide-binding universal stress UspA family protein